MERMYALFLIFIQFIVKGLRDSFLYVNAPQRTDEKIADFQKTLLGRQFRNMTIYAG